MHKTRQCTDRDQREKMYLFMYSCGFDLSLRTAYHKTSNSLGYWQIIPYYYMTFFLLYSSYFKY